LLLLLLLLLQDSPASLTRALRWTYITGGTLTLVLVVAWPLLALPAGVFSKGYFTMWIVIAIVWGLLASGELVPPNACMRNDLKAVEVFKRNS
jgi:hypothetical protein